MRSTSLLGTAGLLLAICCAAGAAPPATALTLRDAITQALERNERGRSAAETARAAGARVWRARSFLLPSITLSGDYSRRGSDGEDLILRGRESRVGRITVEQTLFDAQAWPLLRQAQRARDASRFDAVGAGRLLAFDTAASYFYVMNTEQARWPGRRRRETNQEVPAPPH